MFLQWPCVKSVMDSYKLVNIFNDYFANATYTTQSENYDHLSSALDSLHSSCTKSFSQVYMTLVSANEIKDIIKSSKMKNSCRYDEVLLISNFRRVLSIVCNLLGTENQTPVLPHLPPSLQRSQHHTPLSTIPSSHPHPSCQQNLSTHQLRPTPRKNTTK